jgi:protein subunit release factor A
MNLEDFKNNIKTKYLADSYEKMLNDLADAREMLSDPEMAELAREDVDRLEMESKKLYDEMSEIVKKDREI